MKIILLLFTLVIFGGFLTTTIPGQVQIPKIPIYDPPEFTWETFAAEKKFLNKEVVKLLNVNSDLISIFVVDGKGSQKKRKVIKFIENYLVKTNKINSMRVYIVSGIWREDNKIRFRLYLLTQSELKKQGLPE